MAARLSAQGTVKAVTDSEGRQKYQKRAGLC